MRVYRTANQCVCMAQLQEISQQLRAAETEITKLAAELEESSTLQDTCDDQAEELSEMLAFQNKQVASLAAAWLCSSVALWLSGSVI